MSEWDGISGFDGWSGKLRDLLKDANAAARSEDIEQRFEASERLTQFVENSRPNDEPIKALDDIAKRAAIGLLRQTIDERLASIVERNGELAALGKKFSDAASGARKSAAALRLERATKALESLNDGIVKLKDLRDSLKSAADKDIAAAVDKAMAAAKAARALIEKA